MEFTKNDSPTNTMDLAIVITTPDHAGLNIQQQLLALSQWKETGERFEGKSVLELDAAQSGITVAGTVRMYTTDTRCVDCENVDAKIPADIFFFPTTHRSAAGVQSFSVHPIGNWGNAELGGKSRTLGFACAALMREAIFKLRELAADAENPTDFLTGGRYTPAGMPYDVAMEVTHHGPEISKPCLFLEIGSAEESWKNPTAAAVIAKCILHLLPYATGVMQLPYRITIGIGGPHYAPNFLRVMEHTNIAFGHIVPKHQLAVLDEEMLKQAVERTVGKVELAVLDWKGLGEHKQNVVQLLQTLGLPYEKTSAFSKD